MTDAKQKALKAELDQIDSELTAHVIWVKTKAETLVEKYAGEGLSSQDIKDCCPKTFHLLIKDTLEKLLGRETAAEMFKEEISRHLMKK